MNSYIESLLKILKILGPYQRTQIRTAIIGIAAAERKTKNALVIAYMALDDEPQRDIGTAKRFVTRANRNIGEIDQFLAIIEKYLKYK